MAITRAGKTYFTLNEVSQQVGCSRISIWRWRKKEKIPAGTRYRDKELLFTYEEAQAIYAYAHRLHDDEAAAAFKNQLKLWL